MNSDFLRPPASSLLRAEQVREYLDQGGNAGEREDKNNRPGKRRRVVEEHYEECEPETCAPWAS